MFYKIYKVTCRLGDLKECDGTHSERSARKVPTLRNQRKHRVKGRHLWKICIISVGFDDMLYNNAAKIFGTEGVFVPKIGDFSGKLDI